MIITLYNDRGGSGKSTVAKELALFLQRQRKDSLLVDMDYKMSITKNVSADERVKNVVDLLEEGAVPDKIQSTKYIDLIGGNRRIRDLQGSHDLQQIFKGVESLYSYIFIDTATMKTIESLIRSSDRIIFPLWVDEYSKYALEESLKELAQWVEKEKVKILYLGVDESETTVDIIRDMDDILKRHDFTSFNTAIRYDETVREIHHKNRELRSFVPVSDAAEDFEALTEEFIQWTKQNLSKDFVPSKMLSMEEDKDPSSKEKGKE